MSEKRESVSELNKIIPIKIINTCNCTKAFHIKLFLFESQLRNNNAENFQLFNNFPNSKPTNFEKYDNAVFFPNWGNFDLDWGARIMLD